MPADVSAENYPIRMECCWAPTEVYLIGAKIEDAIGKPTCTTIEFVANNRSLDLNEILGTQVKLILGARDAENAPDTERSFIGTCVSARFLGTHSGLAHFSAELRPWIWLLSLSQNCRIYQEKTAVDIIMEIFGDYGFSGDVQNQTTAAYPTREICVQYRESDLDFVHRLMEEEGIYYYFTHEGSVEKMRLADDVGAHSPVEGATVDFIDLDNKNRRQLEHIYEWYFDDVATTGKVTLNDFNFETPRADLKSLSNIPKGTHSHKNYEIYDYPGHFGETGDGERYARIRMEERAIRYKVWRGTGNASVIEVGKTFELEDGPRPDDENEFLITEATHYLQLDPESAASLGVKGVTEGRILFGDDNKDPYQVRLKAVPKSEVYRMPIVTPWPEIAGIQTAIVTGPSGEEIYTDQYGRVRIQFHWDRLGESNEHSTCWVRCMMPWTGKAWGMIALPRIGQEVVVQFEEGNPDRPMVTGMLYNADTMPPYTLPDNKTQSGIKTRSTKEGAADNFNELRFEDKMGEEEIYFHAEKNFNQVVENDATIEVGVSKADPGDMTLTVYQHLTETLNTGDHTFTVESGSQFISINTDKEETIGGNSTLTVTGDVTETIERGSFSRTVDMGNETTTVSMGDYSVETSMGSISMEAMQQIELKVGGNSIKIDQSGVTIKGIMVKIEAQAMAQTNAPMVKVNGSGMVMIQGGLVKIN